MSDRHWIIGIALFATVFIGGTFPHAQLALANTEKHDREKFVEQICHRIEVVADIHGLPKGFFARLLWKESRFNPNAVSPKGAMGIAQFMPGTADLMKLQDPFEPHSAIVASAQYLAGLKAQFGNWGLAAAGYNAGPGRVANWLAGESGLPFETQDFVETITGFAAFDWTKDANPKTGFELKEGQPFNAACRALPTLYTPKGNYVYIAGGGKSKQTQSASILPAKRWGVQVAAHFSRSKALSIYRNLQRRHPSVLGKRKPSLVRKLNRSMGNRARYQVQLGANSRAEGEKLCSSLKRAGAACIVLKN